jgi:hypothetical protein
VRRETIGKDYSSIFFHSVFLSRMFILSFIRQERFYLKNPFPVPLVGVGLSMLRELTIS